MTPFKVFVFALAALAFRAEAIKWSNENGTRGENYSRDALLSAIPNNDADREYLIKLNENGIVDLWGEVRMVIGEKVLMRVKRCRLKAIKQILKIRNIKTTVVALNLQRLLYRSSHPNQLLEQRNHPFDPRNFNFGLYHTFKNIETFLKHFTQKHKDISKLENLGTSSEKRPIYSVKISLNYGNQFLRNRDEGRNEEEKLTTLTIILRYRRRRSTVKNRKQIILIDCGMHAREWASISFCLYFMNALITGYKENKKNFRAILTKYDFIIIPVMNPDGYVYSHEKDRLWRKTRSKNKSSCQGADLNRNFHNPGECDDKNPCADIYCGDGPFSEPEAGALKALLEKTSGTLKAYFDVHTFGQYWLTPWAKTKFNKPKHFDDMMEVGKVGVDALKKRFRTKYTLGMAASLLYSSNGIAMDYVYEKGFANYSFSLELRDKGFCGSLQECGFLLPHDQILPTCLETTDGVIAAIMAMK